MSSRVYYYFSFLTDYGGWWFISTTFGVGGPRGRAPVGAQVEGPSCESLKSNPRIGPKIRLGFDYIMIVKTIMPLKQFD